MGRAEDTKARIERAALTLFVARGIAETTTREIALAASIAEGTIYRHFPSKEALAEELFLRVHGGLAQAIETAQSGPRNFRDKIGAIVQAYCRAADADWLLFSYHLLAQHTHLIQVKSADNNPVSVVREVLRKGMASGAIAKRDLDLTLAMTLGIVLQPAIHKVYGRIDGPLSRHVVALSEAVWAVLTAKAKG
jgi:AcrR family transcriptional regulator